MKLDARYGLHQALNMAPLGIFMVVSTSYCLKVGMNYYEVGLFFAVFYITMVVLELPSGGLADKYGHLKVFYLSKLLDCLNFFLLIVWDSVEGLLIASAIGGLGRALGSGSLEAWYVIRLRRAGRDKQIHQKLSSAAAVSLLGMSAGALLGGWLPGSWGQALFPENSYTICLWLIVALNLFNLISFPWFYREGETRDKGKEINHSSLIIVARLARSCCGHRVLQLTLLAQLILGFMLSAKSVYWQPYLKSLLDPTAGHAPLGILACLTFLAGALASSQAKVLTKKLGNNEGLTLFILLSAAAACLYMMSAVKVSTFFFVFMLALSMCLYASKPTIASLLHHEVEDDLRASAVSLLSLSLNTGGIIVGFGLSWIVEQYGIGEAWRWGAILAVLFTPLLLLVNSRRGKAISAGGM